MKKPNSGYQSIPTDDIDICVTNKDGSVDNRVDNRDICVDHTAITTVSDIEQQATFDNQRELDMYFTETGELCPMEDYININNSI